MESNSIPRKKALKLLQTLLPSQFESVIFQYNIPPFYLSFSTPQSLQAIEVIRYAEQKEGSQLVRLLETIYQVAPHLEGKSD